MRRGTRRWGAALTAVLVGFVLGIEGSAFGQPEAPQAYRLKVDRNFEITLLANLITLTPGTLSVDVSEDRRTLYVHALDCSDPDRLRRSIADGFERKIREAFQ